MIKMSITNEEWIKHEVEIRVLRETTDSKFFLMQKSFDDRFNAMQKAIDERIKTLDTKINWLGGFAISVIFASVILKIWGVF